MSIEHILGHIVTAAKYVVVGTIAETEILLTACLETLYSVFFDNCHCFLNSRRHNSSR